MQNKPIRHAKKSTNFMREKRGLEEGSNELRAKQDALKPLDELKQKARRA